MLFIKLILAHLLGDFIFQPNSWVADKEREKAKSLYLYLHTFIHFALIMLLLWDLHLWWIAAAVAGTHFIIDLAKLQYQKPNTRTNWFFIDQLLHILVIAGITLYVMKFDFSFIDNSDLLKVIAGAVFVTVPASIIVKMLISGWTPVTPNLTSPQTESLANAGKYIGILERLLVFIFIVVNHWEGVGFMIAAKSVFRFSDLAEAKQRKLTEYVLIGTLLSFGIAVMTGILVKI
ncbi:DUF3307 domain-containing protein [Chryseobacterium taklimakanense]|uniref:DUF3307 domain-containing protein n=1 Tax=Chryseobacterium taklimakanense TaxID=536441 RepID=UPI001EF6F46C|nr:DUF3307 domain-containing protein [Chryseobacterium taklimakanense]MCG7281192.1 DUF3307 domain-containing protein [Chryseobacterium taklimakanense]